MFLLVIDVWKHESYSTYRPPPYIMVRVTSSYSVTLCFSQPNSEEVPLKEFRIPSKESCMQSETEALIEQDLDPPSMAAQSSTKQCSLLTDRLDPSIAFTRGMLPRSCSRDSIRSLRRASSLDDIDGMRTDWSCQPGDPRSNSSECLSEKSESVNEI